MKKHDSFLSILIAHGFMCPPCPDPVSRPVTQAETTFRDTNYNRTWKQFSLPILARKYRIKPDKH
jgi:hypothetical protein